MTTQSTIKQGFEEFIEKGADLEHDRWARWQKYMFSKSFFPEIASQVESIDLDGSPDGLPESNDFNFGVKTGWNSLRDKLQGCVIIPKAFVDRWFRQIDTKYADLSEEEKESDRKETRNYLPLIKQMFLSLANERIESLRGRMKRLNHHTCVGEANGYNEPCGECSIMVSWNEALQEEITYWENFINQLNEIR